MVLKVWATQRPQRHFEGVLEVKMIFMATLRHYLAFFFFTLTFILMG